MKINSDDFFHTIFNHLEENLKLQNLLLKESTFNMDRISSLLMTNTLNMKQYSLHFTVNGLGGVVPVHRWYMHQPGIFNVILSVTL